MGSPAFRDDDGNASGIVRMRSTKIGSDEADAVGDPYSPVQQVRSSDAPQDRPAQMTKGMGPARREDIEADGPPLGLVRDRAELLFPEGERRRHVAFRLQDSSQRIAIRDREAGTLGERRGKGVGRIPDEGCATS